MKLEIVSHCWRYGRLLAYQLSSLVLNPPESLHVRMTVVCASRQDDPYTWQTLDFFSSLSQPTTVEIRWRMLEKSHVFRRAIGRNILALETDADWVWFADCDLAFGPGTLDALPITLRECSSPLVFPKKLLIQKTQALGDAAIAKMHVPMLLDVNSDEFEAKRCRRAIGAIQIVNGNTARSVGYCRGTRWQRPASRWMRAFEDCAFRSILGTHGLGIDVPNVFLLRHSRRGRNDFDVLL